MTRGASLISTLGSMLLAAAAGHAAEPAQELAQRLYREVARRGGPATTSLWSASKGAAFALESGPYFVGYYNRDGSRGLRPGKPSDTYGANRSSCMLLVKRSGPRGRSQESYVDMACAGRADGVMLELTPGGVGELDEAGWRAILDEFAARFLAGGASALAPGADRAADGSSRAPAGAGLERGQGPSVRSVYELVVRLGALEEPLALDAPRMKALTMKTKACRIEVLDATQRFVEDRGGWLASDRLACGFAAGSMKNGRQVTRVHQDPGCVQSALRRVTFDPGPSADSPSPEQYRSGIARCADEALRGMVYEAWKEYARNLALSKGGGVTERSPTVLTGPVAGENAFDYEGFKVKPLAMTLEAASAAVVSLVREYRAMFGEAALQDYLGRGPWYMMKDAGGGKAPLVTLQAALPALEKPVRGRRASGAAGGGDH